MILWLVFFIVIGACVGSFLNVVIYRVPAGLSVVNPPSHCPKCDQRLAWRDNVPVLAWLWLRGRCRYCAAPISPQYPLIEASTALLFGLWYYACYFTTLQPAMAGAGAEATLLILLAQLVLIAALIASTLIDARHYIIPIEIPWIAMAVALVLIPLSAIVFSESIQSVHLYPVEAEAQSPYARIEHIIEPYNRSATVETAVFATDAERVRVSAAPLAGPRLAVAAFGGAIGLAIAITLLRLGLLLRSMEPTDEEHDDEGPLPDDDEGVRQAPLFLAPVLGAFVAALVIEPQWRRGWHLLEPFMTLAIGVGVGYVAFALVMAAIGLTRRRQQEADAKQSAGDEGQVFPPYPRIRREMLKELAFLAFPIGGALVGAMAGGGVATQEAVLAHPWVGVMGGVIAGALAGAGVTWAIRIAGSLGFGKEAMGLGDVHLMLAVGAVGGWQVAVVSFFIAAFIGLAHFVVARGLANVLRLRGSQIPFGPHLAVAALIVMLWREPIMTVLALRFGLPV